MKQMKGISSVLKGSSQYWKGAFSNLGKNFCSCGRGDELLSDDVNIKEERDILKDRDVADIGEEGVYIGYNKEISYIPFKIEKQVQKENKETDLNMKIDTTPNNFADAIENVEMNLQEDDENYSDNQKDYPMNKRTWSHDEDKILLNYINSSNGRNWKKVASILKNKTAQQCAYRYNKLIKNSSVKKWSRNDDILLMELIENFGQNWEEISNYLRGRSAQEIEERYEKKLNPNLKRCKFEKDEDELIMQLHEKYGNQWNEISKYFKDRNASMIKNRFYSFLKKKANIAGGERISNNGVFTNLSNQLSISETYSKKGGEGMNLKLKMNLNNNLGLSELNFGNLGGFTNSNITDNPNMFLWQNVNQHHMNNFGQGSFNNNPEFDLEMENIDSLLYSNVTNIFSGSGTNSGNYSNSNPNSQTPPYTFTPTNSTKNQIPNTKSDSPPKFYNQMLIDDSESNSIPKDLHKLDTDSPKLHSQDNQNFLYDDKNNNFNEHYQNIFKNTNERNNFNLDESYHLNVNNANANVNNNSPDFSGSNMNLNMNIDKNTLIQQYKMLENVFEKVRGLSDSQPVAHTPAKFQTLQNKLDEKRDNLALNLKTMKDDYFLLLSQNPNPASEINNEIKSSLIKQIEILIDLIKTTKLKIRLMQQIEQEQE